MSIHKIICSMSKIAQHFSNCTLTESNLNTILDLDSSSEDFEEYENQSIRYSSVMKMTELMILLKNTPDLDLSAHQCISVSKCIDFIIKVGFIPCLSQTVWNLFRKNNMPFYSIHEDFSTNKKYEELKFLLNSFLNLIKNIHLKPLIMEKYSNVLLAGLCQITMIPIEKPESVISVEINTDRLMRYEQLIEEQKEFKKILHQFTLTDRNPSMIREIIYLLGQENSQTHLRHGIQKLFSNILMKSGGIQLLLKEACDIYTERSQRFDQNIIQEWSYLIHNYYTQSHRKYAIYIAPQLLELLSSNTEGYQLQFRSVAVFCIYLMSRENYHDFIRFFIRPIDHLMNQSKLQTDTNALVSQCIECYHTLFCLFNDQIWCLNPKLIMHSAATIFNIYSATAYSSYYLNHKLEDLVFMIFTVFSDCKDHLKLFVFSPHQVNVLYDICGNMQITYSKKEQNFDFEGQANMVIKLLQERADVNLVKSLFGMFTSMYSDVFNDFLSDKLLVIKGIYGFVERVHTEKLLSYNSLIVYDAIELILKKISVSDIIDEQALTIVLMVIGCILENIDLNCIDLLDKFLNYLPSIAENVENELFEQLLDDVQYKINYVQNTNTFDHAIRCPRQIDYVLLDITKPMWLSRVHSLIELKKMIESGNDEVFEKNEAILIGIKENLKNTDSYLYITAIFALSALCQFYPNKVIPILCEQYSMSITYNHSPEIRLKICEYLMKTIKLLYKTAIPEYKDMFLKAFIAGVRDDDSLVRLVSILNLTELSRYLNYDLGSTIIEIVNCADYTLRFDNAIEPRRASVLLLQLIVQKADFELLKSLANIMQNMFNMLKRLHESDKDVTIRIHSQAAIQKLNDLMKLL